MHFCFCHKIKFIVFGEKNQNVVSEGIVSKTVTEVAVLEVKLEDVEGKIYLKGKHTSLTDGNLLRKIRKFHS